MRKMKKAIGSGNNRQGAPNGSGGNALNHHPMQRHPMSSSSSMDNNFRNSDFTACGPATADHDSCSSLNGNDVDSCNDSSDSGGKGILDHQDRSPSPSVDHLPGIHDLMTRSESAGSELLLKRKTSSSTLQLSSSTSFSSSAHTSMANATGGGSHMIHAPHIGITQQNINPAFRRSMPPHLEDSDGNNADDDSVNSFNVGGRIRSSVGRDYSEDIPTRDVGPDRLGHGIAAHAELGIPIAPTQDSNRSRYVSRVSINGKEIPNTSTLSPANDFRSPMYQHHLAASHSKANSWKNGSGASSGSGASAGASPIPSSNEDHNGDSAGVMAPPTIPARKHSRAGHDNSSGPPQRPPKPGRLRDDSSSTTTIEDDDNTPPIDSNKLKENAEWYEYGCV